MSIKDYIVKESAKENIISSLFCENVWKNLIMKDNSKLLLPVLLYYDDF